MKCSFEIVAQRGRRALVACSLIGLMVSPAHASGLIGTWGVEFVASSKSLGAAQWTFQSNGRWFSSAQVDKSAIAPYLDPSSSAVLDNNNCYVNGIFYTSQAGTYTVSGNALSMSIDHTEVCGMSIPYTVNLGQGTYSITGNMLSIHLTGGIVGPFDIPALPSLAGRPTIVPATPLPPPVTDQSAYALPGGGLPQSAITVTPGGRFGNANLSLALNLNSITALSAAAAAYGFSETAAGYNLYVVAMVPGVVFGGGDPRYFVKPGPLANWTVLQWPLAAFMKNASQSAISGLLVAELLSATDVSSLVGTEIYIGYGTSDQEMLAAGRYRGVFQVK